MLIEMFNDRVYEETIQDLEHGIKSKRVPYTIISERGDMALTNIYLAARDFLRNALDDNYYCIKSGGAYMLEIEHKSTCDTCSIQTGPKKIAEHNFTFKFSSLRGTLDDDKNITIHGELTVDKLGNVVQFKRDRINEYVKPCTYPSVTTTTKIVSDPTSTSGRRIVNVERALDSAANEVESSPFDSGCQQKEPCEDIKGADSNIANESKPVELSGNSFSAEGSTINVSHPELEIGTVVGDQFNIDAEKQKRQDEFLRNMSRKISKRNRQKGSK